MESRRSKRKSGDEVKPLKTAKKKRSSTKGGSPVPEEITVEIVEIDRLSESKEINDADNTIELTEETCETNVSDNAEIDDLIFPDTIEPSEGEESSNIAVTDELLKSEEVCDTPNQVEVLSISKLCDVTQPDLLLNDKKICEIADTVENGQEVSNVTDPIEVSISEELFDTHGVEVSKSEEASNITGTVDASKSDEIGDITDTVEVSKSDEKSDIAEAIEVPSSTSKEECDTDCIGIANFPEVLPDMVILSKGDSTIVLSDDDNCIITDTKESSNNKEEHKKRPAPSTKPIDTNKHPAQVFAQTFPGVKFVESCATDAGDGQIWWSVWTRFEGKVFKSYGKTKKDAKCKLILIIFEKLNVASRTQWTAIDVKKLFNANERKSSEETEQLCSEDGNVTYEMEIDGEQNGITNNTELCDIAYTNELPNDTESSSTAAITVTKRIRRVDTKQYPTAVFIQMFPSVKFIESAGMKQKGRNWWNVMARVEGQVFKGDAATKKDAKLKLVLIAFEKLNIVLKSEWTSVDVDKLFKETDKKVEVNGNGANAMELSQGGEKNDITADSVELCDTTNTIELSDSGEVTSIADVGQPSTVITRTESPKVKRVDTNTHPAQVFAQTFPSVRISASQSKSSTCGSWNVSAEVGGEVFTADGPSKKDAKLKLILIVFENLNLATRTEWSNVVNIENLFRVKAINPPNLISPLGLLAKLNPATQYIFSEKVEGQVSLRCIVKIGETVYRGEGVTEKSAKTDAAILALMHYGIDFPSYVKAKEMEQMNGANQADMEARKESPASLSNEIAKLVTIKARSVFPSEPKSKVVAAFVLGRFQDDNPEPTLEVISMGTGTKCIKGDHMDHQGQTLNDCHGEIIACRGFRRYLYDQLLLPDDQEAECVLERTGGGKFSLKTNIKVYLFINTAPCGDGRVFTWQDLENGGVMNNTNKTAGVLRTKIECGQGTVPVPLDGIQTADGILEGERLRTMSCSDKVLKWNVVGVQGALLSYFINPIYMDDIIIGVHYNYHELTRALFNRVSNIVNLPETYRLHKPFLGSPVGFELRRDTSKSTSHSFNWCISMPNVEVINSSSGKTFLVAPSRLSKLHFFDNFNKLLQRFSIETQPRTYHEAKLLATDYQKAKREFFLALSTTVCGKWVGKPFEHDMFGY